MAVLKQMLSLLLHEIYGIKLKWEIHTEKAYGGRGYYKLSSQTTKDQSRHEVMVTTSPYIAKGWYSETLRPTTIRCAPLVRKSHFPSMLQKSSSIGYALTHEDVRENFRSVMWGVGAKGYPKSWWATSSHVSSSGQDLRPKT